MAFLSNLDIPVSGMMAQRLRMDIISQNVNNATTTRTEDGTPYVRQVVVFSEDSSYDNLNIRDYVRRKTDSIVRANMPFSSVLQMSLTERRQRTGHGVVVTEIVEDETPSPPCLTRRTPTRTRTATTICPTWTLQRSSTTG